MFKGITLVLGACLVWGLIFVIPGLLEGFSPLEVALGRYSCLGLISLFFMLSQGLKKWLSFPGAIWSQAFICSLVVNVLYYISLVLGLRYASAPVTALILGLSPITLAFYGNWKQKECAFRALIFPTFLIGLGLLLVNLQAFHAHPSSSFSDYLFGISCCLFSLIAWNWYIVSNAQFLKANPSLSSSDWSTLIGVSTLGWVLLLGLFIFFMMPTEQMAKYAILDDNLKRFFLGSFILGLVCSWIGSYLWNRGSLFLPVSLAGQLTIFETIFGLIFVYFLEHRLPSALDLLGIFTLLTGVAISMHVFNRSHASIHSPTGSLSHSQ
ncbi:DMT family transporter [Candidatus Protochlamydia phocaeensis]|uniref:DMT family transporter n=1 Tax=Candidatus Protochlamydia phocaeensis TaxID=1414722 RepID=UPI0009ABC364|nr:DMT family transporter [Candidatus Protochlamydia phocaeensis]